MTDPIAPGSAAPIELPTTPPSPVVMPLPEGHIPRAGELTLPWRIVVACSWIVVMLAITAVWNTSVELGLSTWWLGPRAAPQPVFVRLSPFIAPVLMVLGTINRARWLSWFGLLAAAVLAAIGLGDLGRVTPIGVVELVIAAAAGAVSIASLSGTYRAGDGADAGHGADDDPLSA